MNMQQQNVTIEKSPELERLLDVQSRLSKVRDTQADLDRRIHETQAQVDKLKAGLPDVEALQSVRRRVASLVATGDATEGELLQHEQAVETAKFEAAGIVQQIEVKNDLLAGFQQRQEEQANAKAALQAEWRTALLALLMAHADQIGAAYVSAAAQLDLLYRRLTALSAQVGNMTGHRGFRCLGPISVPSFSLPVIEQNRSPIPPYQLVDYSTRQHNPIGQWENDLNVALRAAGVQID
ncbi:MAG TPA: hypothetical protein PK306_05665 [Aquabacterium sp.]|nr:hypothetical protein [Aquabacterium sp.]